MSILERSRVVCQHDPRNVGVLVKEIGLGKFEHSADSSSKRSRDLKVRNHWSHHKSAKTEHKLPGACCSVKIELT